MQSYLKMQGISKYFPGVRANHNVDFEVRKGEVHALLGENGAGKSTLMNILYGLYQPTAGKILFEDRQVTIASPKIAIDLGIGMVHQHFMLIPALSVIENVVLGMEDKKKRIVLNLQESARKFSELAASYNMRIDPWEIVENLTVGQQQRLEILKALYRGAKILILDEPTAVLTPQEVSELFNMIRSLTAQGHTVIMITHKLREVMEICDRITVLRLGEVVGILNKNETNADLLSELMVGQKVPSSDSQKGPTGNKSVLTLVNVCCRDKKKGVTVLENVSFTLHEGEILGIAGVDGNGQSELVDAIVGLRHIDKGDVLLKGETITNLSPREIINRKVAHIPEDRHKRGVILPMNLTENIMMMDYCNAPYAKGIILQKQIIEQRADNLIKEFRVKVNSRNDLMKNLSGGNQQKVVLGREIMRNPELLIAMHPVRGLDISATEYIHQRLLDQRNQGKAILLISTELDEIIKLSDRIAVMYEGKIMDIVSTATPLTNIGLLMAGGRP